MVLDSSAAHDLLLRVGPWRQVHELLVASPMVAAPELLVFELLATWRRNVRRGTLSAQRAAAAVHDLGDLRVVLFPMLPFRTRAWSLRDNITVGDALFVALAELLESPLATKDARLADATRRHTQVPVIELEGPAR